MPQAVQEHAKSLPLGQGHWANSTNLRKKVVDHILARVPSAVEKSKKEESVWISTTRNLNWAIWDISRRLAFAHACEAAGNGTVSSATVSQKGQLQVHLSIIRIDPPARPGDKTPPDNTASNGSRSAKDGEGEGAKKGPSEMWIRPRDVLSSAIDTIPLNAMEQKDCVLARIRASLCEEIMFYGRIFGGSVLADVVFTSTVSYWVFEGVLP